MKSIIAKAAPYLLSAFIAALSFFTGATTDAGKAVSIALDKDKAIIQAQEILNGATPQELTKAIEAK